MWVCTRMCVSVCALTGHHHQLLWRAILCYCIHLGFRIRCARCMCRAYLWGWNVSTGLSPLFFLLSVLFLPSLYHFHTSLLPSSPFRHCYRNLRVSTSHDALQSVGSPGGWWNCSDIYWEERRGEEKRGKERRGKNEQMSHCIIENPREVTTKQLPLEPLLPSIQLGYLISAPF